MRYTAFFFVALASHLMAAPPQFAEEILADVPKLLDEIETRPVATGWGAVRGRVVFTGGVPQKKTNPRNPKLPIIDESLVVNEKNRGLADVIVWLYKPGEIPIHESYDARENAVVTIAHANRRFDPHVNLVRVGQTLQLVNRGRAGINPLVNF
jgi:hypothetical protein